MNRKCILQGIGILGLLAFTAFAGVSHVEQESQRVAELLRKWVDVDEKSPGAVLGVIDGQGRRIYTHGVMKKNGPAMQEDTLFEIGSITKVFTALLLAEMSERGELNPFDPVDAYLPAGTILPRFTDRPILFEHLATQSSGLPRMPTGYIPTNLLDPLADLSMDRLMHFFSTYRLTRPPGSQYEYSNIGFGLLGYALSLIGGMSYETLVAERILSPLGMADTVIDVPVDMQERLATPYGWGGRQVSYWRVPGIPASGAHRSSVPDLLAFLAGNMGLEIPLPETLIKAMERIRQPYMSIDEAGEDFVAWGWHIFDIKGREYFFHNGGTGGFRSVIMLRRDKGWGVVVMVNSANDCEKLAEALIDPLQSPLP